MELLKINSFLNSTEPAASTHFYISKYSLELCTKWVCYNNLRGYFINSIGTPDKITFSPIISTQLWCAKNACSLPLTKILTLQYHSVSIVRYVWAEFDYGRNLHEAEVVVDTHRIYFPSDRISYSENVWNFAFIGTKFWVRHMK